jgi:hypothetical protein
MSKVEYYFKAAMVFLCFLFVVVASMGIWGVLGEDVAWKGLATICVSIVGIFSANMILSGRLGDKNETGN